MRNLFQKVLFPTSVLSPRYEEVTLFSRDHVKPFKFSSPTGHYTALAWADTDKVGLFFSRGSRSFPRLDVVRPLTRTGSGLRRCTRATTGRGATSSAARCTRRVRRAPSVRLEPLAPPTFPACVWRLKTQPALLLLRTPRLL